MLFRYATDGMETGDIFIGKGGKALNHVRYKVIFLVIDLYLVGYPKNRRYSHL